MIAIKDSQIVDLIRSHKSSGFTFTEVLVVLAIVIAISAGAFIVGGNILEYSRYNAAKSQVSAIGMAVTEYKYSYGKYPAKLTDVVGTTSYPISQSYKEFVDPWGREIFYIRFPDRGPNGTAIIICYGADGEMNSDVGMNYLDKGDIALLLD